jgi:hypothetical protein
MKDGGVLMLDLVSTVGGGVVGTGVVILLGRPKAFLTLLVALTAPFPGSRLYQRYSHALAVVHGVQPTPAPEETPALPKGKKKRRRG